MVTDELLDFIRSELEAGTSREEIEASLIGEGGWDKIDVEEALVEIERKMLTAVAQQAATPAYLPAAPAPVPLTKQTPPESTPAPAAGASEPSLAAPIVQPVPLVAPAQRTPEPVPPPIQPAPLAAPATLPEQAFAPPVAPSPRPSGPLSVPVLRPAAPGSVAPPAQRPAPLSVSAPIVSHPAPNIAKIIPDPSAANEAEKIPERWEKYKEMASAKKSDRTIMPSYKSAADPEGGAKMIETRPISEIWAEYGRSGRKEVRSEKDEAIGSRESFLGDGSFPHGQAFPRPVLTSAASVVTAGSSSYQAPLAPGMPVRRIEPVRLQAPPSEGGTFLKTVLMALVGAAFLLIAGAAAWFYVQNEALLGSATIPIEAAVSRTFLSQSFTYGMTLSGELSMKKEIDRSGPTSMDLRTGSAMNGVVAMAPDGFGNGTHSVRFSGAFTEDGETRFGTNMEAEYRVIGDNLYVRFINPPSADIVDPEVFTSYWIRVSMTEIAKQLAFDGVAVADDGLGRFGGSEATSFVGTLKKHMPFEISETLSDEPVDGTPSRHFRLAFKNEGTIAFLQNLYRQYFNTELVFSDDDEVRFDQLLQKLSAEVWVSRADGTVRKFALSGPIDDVLFGYRARGNISFTVTLLPTSEAAAVTIPSPTLTIEEFKNRIDEYFAKQEVRSRDALRIELLDDIERVLSVYKRDKGRYPPVLEDLRLGGYLDSSVSVEVLGQYYYYPYASLETLDKAHRCANRAKLCPFYHLGVNLEDRENLRLDSDADINAELRGRDTAGCAGETGRACLDLVPQTASAP